MTMSRNKHYISISTTIINPEKYLYLQIGYNPIQGEGGLAILVATENNEYECLKHIDFGVSNVPVARRLYL